MKVIKITFKSETIIVETINKSFSKVINSNQIEDNSLFYTYGFIKRNKEIINEIISIKYIENFIYKDFESFYVLGNILKCSSVNFDIEESLTTRACSILLDNERLKYLKCYFIPSDYVHDFASNGVSIILSNDYKFTTNFINGNGFNNLKSIYYKRIINFYREEDVFDNLEYFLRVNTSLKVIHLYFYSNKCMNFVIDMLNKYKETDVYIFIHQNDFNKDTIRNDIKNLRSINKTFNKSEKKIEIIYDDYSYDNKIFKDMSSNVIKVCLVLIMYVGFILIISNKYHEYLSVVELRKLEMSLIDSNDVDNNIDEIDDSDVTPVEPTEPTEPVPSEPVIEEPKYINYYANIPTSFDKLLQINKNVVGWVTVNNTKANYPVLQGPYNEFYNTHDIYDREVITGWIYMDSRNNSKELDQNTIIYGHNLISGYMFGDLKSTTDYSWYTNPANQVITFNTLDKEMKWKIFSIYRVDYTTDYLTTNFYNDEQYMDFINMIKGRSIYDFGVSVNPNDKIITLSTCSGHTRRLVIHAKLIS